MCCGASATAMIVTMYWLLSLKLEEQRKNVYQNLTASRYFIPGTEDDPMNTVFTITNGSSYSISKKHELSCFTRFAVGLDGTTTVESIESTVRKGLMIFSSPGMLDHVPQDSILEPGGDTDGN